MRLFVVLSLFLLSVLPARALQAANPDSQAVFEHSAVRLLDGGMKDQVWKAGIEIEMTGNWKTYWKVPGDAGVPPEFDWSGSQNIGRVVLNWPAPRRYRDDAGESIGYKHHVVFPIDIAPADPLKPVRLKLKLFYAVCDNICIPGQAEVALDLDPTDVKAADRDVIDEFARRVPQQAGSSLRIGPVRPVTDAQSHLNLSVSVEGLIDPAAADIFVSGLETAYVSQPKHVSGTDGVDVFNLRLDGPRSGEELNGSAIEVVVVTPDTAVVRRLTLN